MALLIAPSTNKKILTEHRMRFSAIFYRNFHIYTVEYRTVREKIKYCPIFLLSKNVSHSSVAHLRPELEPFPWRYYLTFNLFPVETGLDWTIFSRYTVTTVQTAQSAHTSNNYLDHSRTIKIPMLDKSVQSV